MLRRGPILLVAGLLLVVVAAVTAPRWMDYLGGGDRSNDASPRAGGRPAAEDVAATNVSATRAAAVLPADLGPSWKQMDDPTQDGWDTETFSEAAGEVLKQLGKLLTHPGELDAEHVEPLIAADFSCGPLVPPERRTAYEDQAVTIERATGDAQSIADQAPGLHRGVPGFIEALKDIAGPLEFAIDLQFKFKMFRVTPSDRGVTTRQYFAISRRIGSGMFEQNATWLIRWRPGRDKEPPKMEWIGVEVFEQVAARNPDGQFFKDCTNSVLKSNACYREQFLLGMNYWYERIHDTRYFALLGNPGLALGDVNGDGLDDLYVCQESGLPNRLFLQQPDGTAREVSHQWEVDWLEATRSALLIDLDNDGDQDLIAAMVGNLIVAANEGERFAIRAVLPCDEDTMSLSSADYDADGDLDLYVCVYFRKAQLEEPRAAFAGGASMSSRSQIRVAGRNSLFRNDGAADGEWRFTDATVETGLDVTNRQYSFASSWEDYDNDGDQDLYVANDYGRNVLYANDGGRFTEVALAAGADDPGFSMSASWGDYDRDGWMDLYVGNMFSAAGGRITYQSKFRPDDPQYRLETQYFARGNTLLKNAGDGTFRDVTDEAAVAMGRWAWGSNFVDLNNDGREDIVVANGFLTTEDTSDL